MNSDIMAAVGLFLGLLGFYWWNEPKAREQDRKRREQQQRQDKAKRSK